ncbi:hypothetical protein [Agrococcus sp. HG114]|uniref:hypothetical protein n=1 Tax=Agrococcus sp. HG114 TaxID=2969757 RepID=UPI00215B3A87|nr:hypothetical protein [Agrococcus sp. HG114]MCR8671497.1 hypothetical protein [Agrococcus sp. HG114]
MTPRTPLGGPRLLLLVLAVTAVLMGLLGMHTLSGGSHAAHDASPLPVATESRHVGDHTGHAGHEQTVAPVDAAGPLAALECTSDGCEALVAMAAGCVLALLVLGLLLLRRAAAGSLVRLPLPERHVRPTGMRRAPALTLAELSISRT